MKIEFKAKLRGELDIDGDIIFVGSSNIQTIVPEHLQGKVCQVEVTIYEEVK